MKLTRQSILAVSSLLVGGLLGASALVAAAGTWTQAPSNPPDNNAEAPVNVSDQVQTKTGLLGLANFQFLPSSLITTVNGVATGNVIPGSVLTAKNNDGTVEWGSVSGIGAITGTVTWDLKFLDDGSTSHTIPTCVSTTGSGSCTNNTGIMTSMSCSDGHSLINYITSTAYTVGKNIIHYKSYCVPAPQ